MVAGRHPVSLQCAPEPANSKMSPFLGTQLAYKVALELQLDGVADTQADTCQCLLVSGRTTSASGSKLVAQLTSGSGSQSAGRSTSASGSPLAAPPTSASGFGRLKI